MFNLNNSLAKLRSFVEENNLHKESQDDKVLKKKNKKKSKTLKAQEKSEKINNNGLNQRGVILIKNFPHGFYEKQMFDYFSQFGEVTRLKIIRSHKTGKPKHYGFIEFRFNNVAKIAAETMNNYLMFDHIIKCFLLPEEKIPKNIFKNWNRPFISSVEKHKTIHNKIKTTEQELRTVKKHLKRLEKMNKILKEKQIDFECVVVNHPKDLSAKQSPSSSKTMPVEIIQMVKPKMTWSSLMRKRRLIFPKFFKLRAAMLV